MAVRARTPQQYIFAKEEVAMVSMLLRQSVMSLVFVYLLMTTALVVGSPRRRREDSYYDDGGDEEGPGLVNFGSLEDLVTISDMSSVDWTVSSSGAAKRSVSSVESQQDDDDEDDVAGETQVEDVLQGLRGSIAQLYHSPTVLALNYKEMLGKLKIYVYPRSHNESKYELSDSSRSEEKAVEPSSTAELFFRNLVESEVVTKDPEEAQLFFFPVSIDRMLLNDIDVEKVGMQLRRYVQHAREEYEFWNRTLGSDHFYVSCHGYPADGHRNFLELSKNAIQVACTPLWPTQAFFPHKDIVMPPHRPGWEEHKESSASLEDNIAKNWAQRTRLVYCNGPVADDPALQSTLEDWKADPDFDLQSESLELPQYYQKLKTTRFCLIITPHQTPNLVDFLRIGCVPVVVSRTGFLDLPLQDVLNWHEFSVILHPKEISSIKHILAGISIEKYQRMQYLGQQASKHMEWNTNPVAYDAFHMILYELWVRRYSIRYARVSSQ